MIKADILWHPHVSFQYSSVVLCCGWLVLLTKSWAPHSSRQHSESDSVSSSLDQSSQQAEKNKSHSG